MYAMIWPPLYPCLILAMGACATLLFGVFNRSATFLASLAMLTLACAGISLWYTHGTISLFDGQFMMDHLSRVLDTMILCAVLVLICFSHISSYDQKDAPEYYTLMLCSTLGMIILTGATHLLTMFVGLELMSLPIVTLVALPGRSRHIEGALKYFITGGVASCLLLYGCSLLYGATGALGYSDIATHIMHGTSSQLLAYAIVFLVSGMAFKLGTAPFHMWVPDVYQGGNTPTTMLLATAAKVASVGMVLRILFVALPGAMETWQPLILAVSLLSIVLGNVIAIVQSNIRRLLAYSSIAHMGYLLLGVYVGAMQGIQAVLFYLLTYVLTSTVAFSSLMALQDRKGEIEDIRQLSGLNHIYPWQALTLLLACFSLAGVPPLLGFMGKLSIFKALVDAHHQGIAAMAILFAVVGGYYYIRVVRDMYFRSEDDRVVVLTTTRFSSFLLGCGGLSLLVLGLYPQWVFLS